MAGRKVGPLRTVDSVRFDHADKVFVVEGQDAVGQALAVDLPLASFTMLLEAMESALAKGDVRNGDMPLDVTEVLAVGFEMGWNPGALMMVIELAGNRRIHVAFPTGLTARECTPLANQITEALAEASGRRH